MDKGKILPLAAMEKLLKKCGAAQHSGRKTVKGSDIKLAVK